MNADPRQQPQTNDGLLFKLEAIYRDIRDVVQVADMQAKFFEAKAQEFERELERIRRENKRRG